MKAARQGFELFRILLTLALLFLRATLEALAEIISRTIKFLETETT